MSDVLGQWPLLLADFAELFRVRLVTEYPGMLWNEFRMLVEVVIQSKDSRVHKHFDTEPVTETELWPDQL